MRYKLTQEDRELAAQWQPLQWCSNPAFAGFERTNNDRIRLKRRYGSQPTMLLFVCLDCKKTFSLRKHTPLHGMRLPEDQFERIVANLGEGDRICKVARVERIKPDTVSSINERMGDHCERVLEHFVRDMWPQEVQLDEMFTFVRKKAKNLSEAEKLRAEFGTCWIWIAIDPETKVILGIVLGRRTKERAIRLLRRVRETLGIPIPPLFTSDELAAYSDALVEVFGIRDPSGKAGKVATDELLHGVVRKERVNGRVETVDHVCSHGDEDTIEQVIEASEVSSTMNTSFVERLNGKLRTNNSRLGRKAISFSKDKTMLRKSLCLTIGYDHFCRPHLGLRERRSARASDGARRWHQRTPMMAAQKTDHIWSVRELILFRVPGRDVRCRYSGR